MSINWQDVLVSVFTTVGGGAVLLGSAAYLIKTSISHRLSQETETFKAQLRANADSEIERLTYALQMAALEHQVRFSKLHEKRAEVIADLYLKLVTVSSEVNFFVSAKDEMTPSEANHRFEETFKSIRELCAFIEADRIYMPVSACTVLDRFSETMRHAVFTLGLYRNARNPRPEVQAAIDAAFAKAHVVIKEELPEIKRQLDREFRAMLGETQDPL